MPHLTIVKNNVASLHRFRIITPKNPKQIIIHVLMAAALLVVHAQWMTKHVFPTANHVQMDATPPLPVVIIVSVGFVIHQPVVLACTIIHRAIMNAKAIKINFWMYCIPHTERISCRMDETVWHR